MPKNFRAKRKTKVKRSGNGVKVITKRSLKRKKK